MARWRHPAVIWLRRIKKEQYWRGKRPRRVRRMPWTSATLYGVALLAAGLVLWRVPANPGTLPVSSRPVSDRPSWMDRGIAGLKAPESTLKAWINDGIPLIGLTLNPSNFAMHVRDLLTTGLTEVSGVHITSLKGLLAMEIPQLAALPHVTPPTHRVATANPSKAPRPKEQDAVDKSLPGAGGRVWAELGKDPQVGLYQTHSHESFWPYVAAGSSTAYSTDWSKTIVQVGWWLSEDLHREGLSVVQSRVDNMSEGVLASYNKSYYTAKTLLKWYPTVRMLIDLHRAPDNVGPANIHGHKVAKILLVVGTNKLLPNPYWHENLQVALKLARALKGLAPGILEGNGIDMVPYRYNQQLMPADLMIEVGGPNNTLAEERYAVHDLAEAIHELFHQDAVPARP
ncbi:stage II sporulation protein P [Sulfobacillus harzensis]|uniref:stage II sporulation protein P n=1 Tax=Sulfobacillus harzensis TaxID=2729629 RepID=UPI003083F164